MKKIMYLAGDIGGTKANLAFFDTADARLQPVGQRTLKSRDYAQLSDLLADFLAASECKVRHAFLSIAGPVNEGRCKTPNLPWEIDQSELKKSLRFEDVQLINDLAANAHGIFVLRPKDFVVLNEGRREPHGNAALISAGTGLGQAGLFYRGEKHVAMPSEGGHCSYSPCGPIETELLEYLQRAISHDPKVLVHVSTERVLSGPGLFNIYKFLRDTGKFQEPDWLAQELTEGDPTATVARAGLAGKAEICVETLNLFATVYGAAAGDLALTFFATGGVYIGGGIAPKILKKLQEPYFMEAFVSKGRMRTLLEAIPIKVIMNEHTALLGAAEAGRERFLDLEPARR